MIKIEKATIIGYKSWKKDTKQYMLIAVTYTDKDTTGKMCGTVFVNKPYTVGETVDLISHQGRLYIL